MSLRATTKLSSTVQYGIYGTQGSRCYTRFNLYSCTRSGIRNTYAYLTVWTAVLGSVAIHYCPAIHAHPVLKVTQFRDMEVITTLTQANAHQYVRSAPMYVPGAEVNMQPCKGGYECHIPKTSGSCPTESRICPEGYYWLAAYSS